MDIINNYFNSELQKISYEESQLYTKITEINIEYDNTVKIINDINSKMNSTDLFFVASSEKIQEIEFSKKEIDRLNIKLNELDSNKAVLNEKLTELINNKEQVRHYIDELTTIANSEKLNHEIAADNNRLLVDDINDQIDKLEFCKKISKQDPARTSVEIEKVIKQLKKISTSMDK